MSDPSVEQMTLRQRCTAVERLVSELVEHLDRGFVPKARGLRKLVRNRDPETDGEPVTDVTLRNHAALVLESDRYTETLYAKGERLFSAIQQELEAIVRAA